MILQPLRHPRLVVLTLVLYAAMMALAVQKIRVYIRQLPSVSSLQDYTPSLITRIYDVRGELVSELFVERRTVVPLTQVPLDFQRAVIAIEDRNFYEHWGVDLRGILRAAVANARARRAVQGGSTITQQLAKNIFLSHSRTLHRKIKEMLLTLQMETNLSKDEILQLYINQIYFGNGAYGVDAAARTFFGKNVADLSLGECALLAGLPKAPQYYSPFSHPGRAARRRNIVLRRMRELGFITDREELNTVGRPLGTLDSPSASSTAAYFVEYLRILLEPKYGSAALFREGLSIHTTLDLRMQRAAEEATQKHLTAFDEKYAVQRMEYLLKHEKITQADFDAWKKSTQTVSGADEPPPEPGQEPVPVQGALVAIDPETGGVRALVGGRDFAVSQFNRAVQAKRQPGSTFKPFVWLAALESGYTAATLVDDYPLAYINVERHPELVAEATDYATLLGMVTGYYPPEPEIPEPVDPDAPPPPDPVWKPKNWDDKYLGPVSLRRGLAFSRNLVSVRLIDRVGPRTVADYAHRVGIVSPLASVLSLGLGSSVVTPLELVGAMGTLANEGVHMPPFAVERVVDNQGRVLEEAVPQGQTAISPQTNYLITRLMQAVVQEGTGRRARQLGRPAAGKTGTTQEMRDTWFIGFVPDLAAGVWIGYDDFVPLGKGISSAATSVPWWTDFMAEAIKYVPARDFPVPPGIVFAKIDSDTGLLALPSCRHVVLEAFRQNAVPREFCNIDHDALVPEGPETEIVE